MNNVSRPPSPGRTATGRADAIALACLGGFTYREIAGILDVSPVLAARTITRGLEGLSNRTAH